MVLACSVYYMTCATTHSHSAPPRCLDNESEDNEDLSVEMELGQDNEEYAPGERRQMAAMM